ncbi:MAG: hypothetical protein PF569_08790 [Candidatus Woesearchaeota archaeon]|jgi:hypothetical protein|nr:hypothetical protein [Candidatus Woesearchaeota archaeon]
MHSKLIINNLETELKKSKKINFQLKIIDDLRVKSKINVDYHAFFLIAPIEEEFNPTILTGNLDTICTSLENLKDYQIIPGSEKNGIYFFPSTSTFISQSTQIQTKSSILKRFDTTNTWINIIMYPNQELLEESNNKSTIEYSMYSQDLEKIRFPNILKIYNF